MLRNFDDLNMLVCVAENNSFSAAARALHVTPKTVSKQIARLEGALQLTLFERNTRSLRITAEGQTIVEHAHAVLAAIDALNDAAAQGSRTLSGNIRLTAPAPFGRMHVAPAISAFRLQYPGVGFELNLSDQITDLYRGNFDLAIRIGALEDSSLLARRVSTSQRVLVASPRYLQAHGQPRKPEDLQHHQTLLFAYPGLLRNDWTLLNGKREVSVPVRGALRSDNGEVLRTWCLDGLGIAMRETWDIPTELADGRLIRVLPEWQLPAQPISLVRAQRMPAPERLKVFMNFLAERWRNLA